MTRYFHQSSVPPKIYKQKGCETAVLFSVIYFGAGDTSNHGVVAAQMPSKHLGRVRVSLIAPAWVTNIPVCR